MSTSNIASALCALLASWVGTISEKLRSLCEDQAEVHKINSGVWSNEAGLIVAYVTCLPRGDPSGDSVDATVSLQPDDHGNILSADVCWSSGQLIFEGPKTSVFFSTPEKALVEVNRFCESIETELVTSLVAHCCK